MALINENPSRWKIKDLPRKGWRLVDVIDTEDIANECEWCGTNIRYVHYLVHDEDNLVSTCGCICAEHLTQDYVNPRKMEKKLKSEVANKKRKLKKRAEDRELFPLYFKKNEKGNYWHKFERRIFILIFKSGNGFRLKIGDEWGKKFYESWYDAARTAFDYVNPVT